MLQNFEELFDVTLGTCKRYPVHFKLKEDVKPIFLMTYSVPKTHKEMFINRLNV